MKIKGTGKKYDKEHERPLFICFIKSHPEIF